ncbi:hypothetical protein LUZ60_003342 [Juncus effusus]|nr:hypothetical protein LUZ60_003342 [Juncus effusus]
MVTDQELASCVESLLRQAGPTVTASAISVPNLVRHLEEKLGLDLSSKEPFIRHHIAMLLAPPPPPPQKDRFAPALFQQFQYHHPSNLTAAAIAATSAVAYQGQQEALLKYQSVQEPLGGHVVAAASPAVDVAEPVRVEEKPAVVAASGSKESTTPAVPKRRGGPGGLNKMCGVSPELQTIVGQPTMARTQIVKQLWAYIRKNNLQDPNNKRKIICNDELRLVFETDCTDMFKMNKLLAKHIISLSEPSREGKRQKRTEEVVSFEGTEADKLVGISDALSEFLGTGAGGERKMLRSEALEKVWDHIRNNRLEDPMNGMVIICDEKLQQLFGCESVSALGISELLSRHLFQQS